jgi:hypothetical protein
MPTRSKSTTHTVKTPQVIPLAYAGKWIAWSTDGLRIVAVASSFKAAETATARAGFAIGTTAIERVPETRDREPSPRR